MATKEQLEAAAMLAARDLGVATILFRNTIAKALNLNLTESLCLTLLGIKGRLAPSQLSRLIGLTTGSVTAMIDRLEKKNYVLRKANSADRRGIAVELTDHYRKQSRSIVQNVQKAHKELMQSYSETELSVIAGFLSKFTLNLINNSGDVRFMFGT